MDKYILTAEEIAQTEGLEKTHYLNDQAQRVNKSLGDMTGLSDFGFHIIEIKPGFYASEPHKHYHEDECVYVLEGKAEAVIGGNVHTIKAGDFIAYRAGGESHSLRNTGDEVLKCIVVGARHDHDVADYPKLGKRLYRHKNMPWNLVNINQLEEPVAGKKT